MAFKMKRPTFNYGSSKMRPALYQKKQEDFEPAYEGGDYSFADLAKMSKSQLIKKFGEEAAKNIEKDLIKQGYRLKPGEQGPVKDPSIKPDRRKKGVKPITKESIEEFKKSQKR